MILARQCVDKLREKAGCCHALESPVDRLDGVFSRPAAAFPLSPRAGLIWSWHKASPVQTQIAVAVWLSAPSLPVQGLNLAEVDIEMSGFGGVPLGAALLIFVTSVGPIAQGTLSNTCLPLDVRNLRCCSLSTLH